MKSLHIRNLDDATLSRLKRRAARHHRSLQKEIEALLQDAARMLPPEEDEPAELTLNTVASGENKNTWQREDLYGDDAR